MRQQQEDDEPVRAAGESVTVERGPEAEEATARLGATAVTIGNRVLLGRDVRPGSSEGRATMRHEQLHAQQVALGRTTGRSAPETEVEAQASRAERGQPVGALLPADPGRPHLQGGGVVDQVASLAGGGADSAAAKAALEEKATEVFIDLLEKRVPHGKLIVAGGKVGAAFIEGIGDGMAAARGRLAEKQSGGTLDYGEDYEAADQTVTASRRYLADAAAELGSVAQAGAVAAARQVLHLVQAEVEGWATGKLEELTGPLSEALGELAHDVAVETLGETGLVETAVQQMTQKASSKALDACNDALVTAVTQPGFEWAETQLDTEEQLAADREEGGAGLSESRAAQLSQALAAQMGPGVVAASVKQKAERIQGSGYLNKYTDTSLTDAQQEEFGRDIAVALLWLERAVEVRAEISEGLSFSEGAFEVGADMLGAVGLRGAADSIPQVGTTLWLSLKEAADRAASALGSANYTAPIGHDFEGEIAALHRIADEARRNAD